MTSPVTTVLGSGVTDAFQIQETKIVSGNQQAERLQEVCKTLKKEEEKMTGFEMIIAKEIVSFAAKAIFDMAQSEDNNLTADQAKAHAKSAMSEMSEQAQKAFIHNLPKHLKL